MRGNVFILALVAVVCAAANGQEPVRINMFRGMWADAPEEQKGPLCNACLNLVEQLVPSLIDPGVQQNVRLPETIKTSDKSKEVCFLSQFIDIFVAVCNLAETMLDPPDLQLAAECRYMPEVYGVDIMEFAYEGGNAPENVCGFLLGLDVLGGQTCPSVIKGQ